jgi:hypothetical protein
VIEGVIADDQRMATRAAGHDAELRERLATKLSGDLLEVRPSKLGVTSAACARRIAGNRPGAPHFGA